MVIDFDPRVGFFVWCYYPEGGHTMEACRGFCEALLAASGAADEEVQRRADGLHRTGGGSFVCLDASVGGAGRWPRMTLDVRRLASCTDREFGCCDDSSVRPGSHTALLVGDKRYTRPRDTASMAAFLWAVGEFVRRFVPTFGFGCREFNHWCENRGGMPPPESRLWPVTIFDLASYPRDLVGRLTSLVGDGRGEWSVSALGGRHAVLTHDPLGVRGTDIDPSASEAVIGSGEGMLSPLGECGSLVRDLCGTASMP